MAAKRQAPEVVAGNSWTNAENDLIVADYFDMLIHDFADKPYSKAEHNRTLQKMTGRTRGSIEYKHQNISAVLMSLGEFWIPGYKPAKNYQSSLVNAIERWLKNNPGFWQTSVTAENLIHEPSAILTIDPPPAPRQDQSIEVQQMASPMAHKFDFRERQERNRVLGKMGEEFVLRCEKARLTHYGRNDLARCVKWISEVEGDGAGYDIESYSVEGDIRLIEVKTTNGWERTPFHISRNELNAANDRPEEWRLMRLWNFARRPRAFQLKPPLDTHVKLCATSYEAVFP